MPKKSDSNQKVIVAALRKVGVIVTDLHTVGKGCPDILCSWGGAWTPLEIKNGKGRLTPDEVAWHEKQKAVCPVVNSVEDAIEAVVSQKVNVKEYFKHFERS